MSVDAGHAVGTVVAGQSCVLPIRLVPLMALSTPNLVYSSASDLGGMEATA